MEWYRDTSGMNCRFCADANIRFKELDRNTGTPRYLCPGVRAVVSMEPLPDAAAVLCGGNGPVPAFENV